MRHIESKTILSKIKEGPDPYFGILYNMNIYRGCQHQCIYCDSRSNVYGLGDLSDIRVKSNALLLLKKAFTRKLHKGTIGTGSMNDPYMKVEEGNKTVRSALKIIDQFNFPVHIITKSTLVERDVDIIKSISSTYAAVTFTITTTDDHLAKVIEPAAPAPSMRLKAIKKLSDNGIYTGVVLTPVLPFITDNKENITRIIKEAKDAGAQYIIGWMGMTLREGQREYYYDQLDKHFPGLKNKYTQRFGKQYGCSPVNYKSLVEAYHIEANKCCLPTKMDFFENNSPKQLRLF